MYMSVSKAQSPYHGTKGRCLFSVVCGYSGLKSRSFPIKPHPSAFEDGQECRYSFKDTLTRLLACYSMDARKMAVPGNFVHPPLLALFA